MKTFAEFFAGIGLIRAGLTRGDWHCAYANDIEPKKQQMYFDQFGYSPEYHLGDIWDADTVLSRLPRSLTLATASFPCTDLSVAGHWRGIDGKHSSTFFAFVDVLRRLEGDRPPIVLIENVLGFIKSNGGADFSRACGELSNLGYWLDAVVVDAKWFVPQSRPRIFLIGVEGSLRSHSLFAPRPNLFGTSHANLGRTDSLRPLELMSAIDRTKLGTGWVSAALPEPPKRFVELAEMLDGDDDQDWWAAEDVDRHLHLMQAPSRDRIRQLMSSTTYTLGTAFRRTRLGKPRTETRFDIAGCLRTPRGGSARQIVLRVGRGTFRMRWMSANEYARLQGIGDFKIRVPVQQALFGFGDAVCVPAIQWLDTHLLSPLSASLVQTEVQSVHGHVFAS